MQRRSFLRNAALGGVGLTAAGALGTAAMAGVGRWLLGWGHDAPPWHLPLQRPILAAHRGGAGLYPEHTLAAYQGSYQQYACRFMELDVRATRDGEPVLIHDATVDRTTNGHGAVSDRTLSELAQLDAGYRFSGPDGERWSGRGLTIPTLKEVLHVLPDCVFSIEIKQEDPPIEAAVLRDIRLARTEDRVVLGSARHGVFQRIRALAPDLATFFSFRSGLRFWLATTLGLDGWYRPMHNVLMIPERYQGMELVTPNLLAAAHRLGIPVLVFTVNDAGRMEELLTLGVDGIVTDRPDRWAAVAQRLPTE